MHGSAIFLLHLCVPSRRVSFFGCAASKQNVVLVSSHSCLDPWRRKGGWGEKAREGRKKEQNYQSPFNLHLAILRLL